MTQAPNQNLNNKPNAFNELEQIASILSHDVKGSFHHITCFTDLIRKELDAGNIEVAQSYLSIIDQSADKLSQIISELVAYANLHKLVKHETRTNLKSCLHAAIDKLAPTIAQTSSTIHIDVSGELRIDTALMTQVFVHILENAIIYKHPNRLPEIHISSDHSEEFLTISIKDNGSGIPLKFQNQAFDLMRRFHTAPQYTGHGVGLAKCRRIIELHGGTINLDSEYVDGCRILITFPIDHKTA
ncbi:sensor histidine kinase [Hirschia baltica]|uniref:histidine kinase n=1 Tax=Hirschia baltica (strain ATCC 49814 / DSM 5838 / IFAM 1418) TaxID=582402 RepID=C6XJ22_HIRBI|nr:ATP-binding protein [Hirschia baltica]ACT59117.1 histidine kinase [Hirschia baltica ATCC 49814]